MKTLSLFLLLGVVLFTTGCPKSKPNVPPVVARRLANYEVERFEKEEMAYNTAAEGNLPDQARRLRDKIIYRLKANIDANYQDFENQLFTGRARNNILFDITEIGTAVAINITNGERAKNIIAAALTGFKGGRKSIDENLFMERTTQVIISQMQASRSRYEETLLTNMRDKGTDEYPLEAALGDLINYFYAGSLHKGLQELAKQTGQDALEAEGRVLRLKGVNLSEPVTDEADLADPRAAVKTLGTLNTLLTSGTSEQQAEAREKLQSIFTALEADEDTLRAVHEAATGVTAEETDGVKLLRAIQAVARKAGNSGPVRAKINRIIIDKGKL